MQPRPNIKSPRIVSNKWSSRVNGDQIRVRRESRRDGLTHDLRLVESARASGIDGLLLKWDAAGRHPIWMADMRFPLDLAWIDANGRVIGLSLTCPVSEPAEPDGTDGSVAVLELRAGAAATYGILVGTALKQ
jgi:uncharacterized membrane protein (UPF0127 family)